MRSQTAIFVLLLVSALLLGGCWTSKGDDALTGHVIADLSDMERIVAEQQQKEPVATPEEYESDAGSDGSSGDGTDGGSTDGSGQSHNCGNGRCERGEDCSSCSADCGCTGFSVCDDGRCASVRCFEDRDCGESDDCTSHQCLMAGTPDAECTSENLCGEQTEPARTGSSSYVVSCGNGICDEAETVETCAADCSVCGDTQCTGGETLTTCAADCSVCSDGQCTGPETLGNCPADCSVCGDTQCTGPEDETNCAEDCAPTGCVNDSDCGPGQFCGGGVCYNYPQCADGIDNDGDGFTDFSGGDSHCDNPADPHEGAVCSDAKCETGENNLADPRYCPNDCGASGNTCSVDPDCPAREYCNLGSCDVLPACSDGIDTDGDGPVDAGDVSCLDAFGTYNPGDTSEAAACGDAICEPEEAGAVCPADCLF